MEFLSIVSHTNILLPLVPFEYIPISFCIHKNDIGHNNGNLVVACLECNLKRRRTNKDAFMFTKNMVIVREGLI